MLHRLAIFLDRWYWLALVLATPFLLFPSAERAWVMLVVPDGWLLAWLATGRPLPRTPLNLTLLVFTIMVGVSLYATYSVEVSLPKLSGLVLGLGAFFAIAKYSSPTNPQSAIPPSGWWASLAIFVVIGVGIAAVGLLGTRWIAKFPVLTPLTSQFVARITTLPGAKGGLQPNEVAGGLLWVVPILICLALLFLVRPRSMGRAYGWGRVMVFFPAVWVLATFTTGVLILTQSRSAYIGLALAIVAGLFVVLPRVGRLLLAFCVGGAVVVGILVFNLMGPEFILERSSDTQFVYGSAFSMRSLQGRIELWSHAVQGIEDYKFTGMGLNTFRGLVHVLYPEYSYKLGRDVAHAHNELIQAGLDLGIPGLIAFIALYIGALVMLWEVWRVPARTGSAKRSASTDPSPLARAMALGLGGGLFAHLIYGMTDTVALGAKPGILFWMLLGLICGLYARQVRVAAPARPAEGDGL